MPKITAKRKKRKREEVQDEILKHLASIDHPTTTTEIASAVGLNWYSAIAHLSRLEVQGKVFHKKIGRQDQWFDVNVDESRKLSKELKATVDKQNGNIRKLERDKDNFVIVTKCLVSGAKEFSEIQDKTKLGSGELRRILGELETKGLIEKKENKFRLVN